MTTPELLAAEKDRSIPAVIARLRFGDSDGDDHDIAADEIERLRAVIDSRDKALGFEPLQDDVTGNVSTNEGD